MPVELREVPTAPPTVYTWLRQQPPSVILEWPIPRAASLGVTQAPLYMYYSTFHWQRLINGYSGFYPPSYIRLIETVRRLPSRDATDYLKRRSVDYVIVHAAFEARFTDLVSAFRDSPDLELLFIRPETEGEIAVFRLRR